MDNPALSASLVMCSDRFKVIDTDDETAVVYQCYGVSEDGRCRRHLEQVDILSRQPTLNQLTRGRLYELIKARLCVDLYDFVQSAQGLLYTVYRKKNCAAATAD